MGAGRICPEEKGIRRIIGGTRLKKRYLFPLHLFIYFGLATEVFEFRLVGEQRVFLGIFKTDAVLHEGRHLVFCLAGCFRDGIDEKPIIFVTLGAIYLEDIRDDKPIAAKPAYPGVFVDVFFALRAHLL